MSSKKETNGPGPTTAQSIGNISQDLAAIGETERRQKWEIENAALLKAKADLKPMVEAARREAKNMLALRQKHESEVNLLAGVDWQSVARVYDTHAICSRAIPTSISKIQGWWGLVDQWQKYITTWERLCEADVRHGIHLVIRQSIGVPAVDVTATEREIAGLFQKVRLVHQHFNADALEVPVSEMRFLTPAGVESVPFVPGG